MRRLFVLTIVVLWLIPGTLCGQETGKGKIGVATNMENATIYVDGRKKATAGEGYTEITVDEGDHDVMVEKSTPEGVLVYRGKKTIFVGEDTFVKIRIDGEKIARPADELKPILGPEPMISRPIEPVFPQPPSVARQKEPLGGMDFVLIKTGTFYMGSLKNENGRDHDEPQHKVRFDHPFYMQTTEVTQAQWKAIMGENPAQNKEGGDQCPVENVSWGDVQRFILKLNEKLGTDKYRLPTEAEWEYACRAGTETAFSFGDCLSSLQANYDANFPMKGCMKGDFVSKTLPVGSYGPNDWGLYDMHGNVWEWCSDWIGAYDENESVDPVGPPNGTHKVARGGSWYNGARDCRSANRGKGAVGYKNGNLGFRLVREP